LTNVEQIQESKGENPTEQLVFHLLRHPCDLIDTSHLMRRFHASAADVQLALKELEQIMLQHEEKAAS
jgi:hypothetical protein